MNKILNLTTNEIIKQFKKKSMLVIMMLIFLSSIFLPIIINVRNSDMSNYSLDSYKYQIESAKEQMEYMKGDAYRDKIDFKYLESELEYNQFLLDNNVEYSSWRHISGENYFNTLTKIDVIELLEEGIPASEVARVRTYVSELTLEELVNTPMQDLQKIKKELVEYSNRIKKSIQSNDYLGYLSLQIEDNKSKIADIESRIKQTENQLKNKSGDEKEDKKTLEQLNNSLRIEKEVLKVLDYRYDNKIEFKNKEWKSDTLDDIIEALKIAQITPMSEEEYIKSNSNVSYDKYMDKYNVDYKENTERIKKDWYSLENNIPQAKFEISAKSTTNSLVGIYAMMASVIVIIIAGGIVSSEFSKNTIKLLAIRPVSRLKIMISKLLAVLGIGYLVLFVAVILTTITGGFIWGFQSLGIPVLKMSGDVVTSQNYILSLILQGMFYSISMIFIGSFAFALSTLTKSTAVSVGISILGFIGSMPLTLLMVVKNYIWFANTPLPYVNLTFMDTIREFSQMFSSSFMVNPSLGAIELLACTLVCIVVSFVYFIKSDIK